MAMRIRQSAQYAALQAGEAADEVQNAARWTSIFMSKMVELLADFEEDGIVLSVESLEPILKVLMDAFGALIPEPFRQGIDTVLDELRKHRGIRIRQVHKDEPDPPPEA